MGHFPQSIDVVDRRRLGRDARRRTVLDPLRLHRGHAARPRGGAGRRTRRAHRAGAAPRDRPDLRQLFLGAEGTLGIVTEVTVRVFPLPESRKLLCFGFPDFDAGLEAIRRIVRAGWRPPVVRLYDAHGERRATSASGRATTRCFLLVVSEGPAALDRGRGGGVPRRLHRPWRRSRSASAPVEHWLAERNNVPSLAVASSSAASCSTPSRWRRLGSHPRALPRGGRRAADGGGRDRRLRPQLAQLRAGDEHLLHLRRPPGRSRATPRRPTWRAGSGRWRRRCAAAARSRTTTASAACAAAGWRRSSARALAVLRALKRALDPQRHHEPGRAAPRRVGVTA